MATAAAVLTILSLNLFLAVCCSVFDGVMDKLRARQRATIARAEKLRPLVESGMLAAENSVSMLGLVKHIKTATESAMQKAATMAEQAMTDLKPSEVVYHDYEDRCRRLDWAKHGSRTPRFRNTCKRLVLSRPFYTLINVLITVNSVILCTNYPGMPNTWRETNVAVESTVMLFFWFEFIAKLCGIGMASYFKESTNRLDCLILLLTSAGNLAAVIESAEEQLAEAAGGTHVSGGLRALNSLRIVK